jgi:hypothetical protein
MTTVVEFKYIWHIFTRPMDETFKRLLSSGLDDLVDDVAEYLDLASLRRLAESGRVEHDRLQPVLNRIRADYVWLRENGERIEGCWAWTVGGLCVSAGDSVFRIRRMQDGRDFWSIGLYEHRPPSLTPLEDILRQPPQYTLKLCKQLPPIELPWLVGARNVHGLQDGDQLQLRYLVPSGNMNHRISAVMSSRMVWMDIEYEVYSDRHGYAQACQHGETVVRGSESELRAALVSPPPPDRVDVVYWG